jgi:tRNA A37 threonylcarbamoyltransferase TsaD
MNALMIAYAALLFVVLTPGVLLRLPPKGSKLAVAVTHGVVFAIVWHFTHKMVWRAAYEGFQPRMSAREGQAAAQRAVKERMDRIRAEKAAAEAAARAATPV